MRSPVLAWPSSRTPPGRPSRSPCRMRAIGGLQARRHRDDLRGGRDRSVRGAGGPLRRCLALVVSRLRTRVGAGYQPEVAYFECLA